MLKSRSFRSEVLDIIKARQRFDLPPIEPPQAFIQVLLEQSLEVPAPTLQPPTSEVPPVSRPPSMAMSRSLPRPPEIFILHPDSQRQSAPSPRSSPRLMPQQQALSLFTSYLAL
ncbi:uncharacterized protein BDZ99DRAFT_468112 [Mytilinidion resinicola]|uniref:Uncharacterized protein n=1 Tax=Mytilinidion resinicola TaxID=574789 RepID=A0A6A6Y462_9PEZI|nr:uncharacterized protein BDZ99DRAFT_468112 [Mytilinidion resinicola]KAF2803572.1 hypothetical protein BDZ99DRAFT_468112 [Mytilinidion resinicola]